MSSARDADRAWLGALARQTGGEAFDLGARRADEVLGRLTRRVPRVLDVRTAGGANIEYSLLDGGENGWRIVGPMPRERRHRRAPRPACPRARPAPLPAEGAGRHGDGAGALWAAEQVALIAASDERSRDDIVAFSRRFSVASPDVSFIVLENGRDYAEAADRAARRRARRTGASNIEQVRAQMIAQETSRRAKAGCRPILAQWREMRQWRDRASRPGASSRRADSEEARRTPCRRRAVAVPSPPPLRRRRPPATPARASTGSA